MEHIIDVEEDKYPYPALVLDTTSVNSPSREAVSKETLHYQINPSSKAETHVVEFLIRGIARNKRSWPLSDSTPSPWTYEDDKGDAEMVMA